MEIKIERQNLFIKMRRMHKRIGGLLLFILLLCGLTGCEGVNTGSVSTSVSTEQSQTLDSREVTLDSTQETKTSSQGAEDSSNDEAEAQTTAETSELSAPAVDRFSLYLSLLNKFLEDVDKILGEESEKTEEEAFSYKNANILVWFDRGEVSKIWTADKTIDFNGAHLGDDIKKFKDVFGEPNQDVKGEAHFGYDGYFLVVQYDTTTGETKAMNLLSEDYGYE